MPRMSPAFRSLVVTSRSSWLGVVFPDGWLCATMTAASSMSVRLPAPLRRETLGQASRPIHRCGLPVGEQLLLPAVFPVRHSRHVLFSSALLGLLTFRGAFTASRLLSGSWRRKCAKGRRRRQRLPLRIEDAVAEDMVMPVGPRKQESRLGTERHGSMTDRAAREGDVHQDATDGDWMAQPRLRGTGKDVGSGRRIKSRFRWGRKSLWERRPWLLGKGSRRWTAGKRRRPLQAENTGGA